MGGSLCVSLMLTSDEQDARQKKGFHQEGFKAVQCKALVTQADRQAGRQADRPEGGSYREEPRRHQRG